MVRSLLRGVRALLAGLIAGLLAYVAASWVIAGDDPGLLLEASGDVVARAFENLSPPPRDPWAERFGVAAPGDPRSLAEIGARWYYDYWPSVGDAPRGYAKVGTLRAGERNGTPLAQVRRQARAYPGRYWLVFNEPDLAEQDKVSDAYLAARGEERFAYYARRYHEYRTTLREADPTAKLVGPNLFNLDERFDAWIDAFRAAHRARYGTEPSFDVWGFHLYLLDWQRSPMLDRDYALRTIERFRAYVANLPEPPARIWATELGALWAWDRPPTCLRPDCLCAVESADGRCAAQFAVPVDARYAAEEIADYTAWLVPELAARGVERWFFFSGQPAVDPPFVPPPDLANGPSLFDGTGKITPIGERYRQLIRAGPPPDAAR